MKLIKTLLITFTILVLINPVHASETRHEPYSKANPSDEGIYIYFSDIIKSAEKILKKILEEGNTLKTGNALNEKVRLTKSEIRFYEIRGVKTNASRIVEPFVSLSDGIKTLSHSQHSFLKNIERLKLHKNDGFAYTNARAALLKMEMAANKLNDSVNEIDKIELRNETSSIHFKTNKIRSLIGDVRNLIDDYENLLSKFEVKRSFTIAISDENPILLQEVEIYIYAKNVTPLSLFIDDKELKLKGNTLNYKFKEVGKHTLYASGLSNGSILKSNVLSINVTKIPTYILLSSESAAYLNQTVEINGFLVDYYGNPLPGEISIKFDNNSKKVFTKGLFNLSVTRAQEGYLTVLASYKGNITHESCNASTTIFFSRFPVTLSIIPDRGRVEPNENVTFKGHISVPDAKIYIFVNSSKASVLHVSPNFNFTLSFKTPGTYTVYAYFPGNSQYMPVKSNSVKIAVGKNNYLIFAILSGLVIASTAYFSKKRRVEKVKLKTKIGAKPAKPAEPEKPQKKIFHQTFENPSDAYNNLFKVIARKYNVAKSLTPREVLEILKKEQFAEKLKIITKLHEKSVYSGARMDEEELRAYFTLIGELIHQMEG